MAPSSIAWSFRRGARIGSLMRTNSSRKPKSLVWCKRLLIARAEPRSKPLRQESQNRAGAKRVEDGRLAGEDQGIFRFHPEGAFRVAPALSRITRFCGLYSGTDLAGNEGATTS